MKFQVDSPIERVTCHHCGQIAADATQRLAWCRQCDRRGESWLCVDCTRDQIRAIEVGFDGP